MYQADAGTYLACSDLSFPLDNQNKGAYVHSLMFTSMFAESNEYLTTTKCSE